MNPWSAAEESIVRNAKNRDDAHKQLKAKGYQRTENATWSKYRKVRRKTTQLIEGENT